MKITSTKMKVLYHQIFILTLVNSDMLELEILGFFIKKTFMI